MAQQTAKEQLGELYGQLMAIREQMREVQKAIPPQAIDDYRLLTESGEQVLSSFFRDKEELFVIHNMGTSCVYCTVWADGFNGVIDHLQDRAAWLLTSPDDVGTQKAFAQSRQWRMPMASLGESTLAKDLGYQFDDDSYMPGVSVIRKSPSGKLVRVADSPFGPGDQYCSVFNLFDLIPGNTDDWVPKFAY